MKQVLEIVVVVGALLLAGLLFREVRVRAQVRAQAAAAASNGVGTTSDTPVPGTPPAVRAVVGLPPIKTHQRPRVLRAAAPPPPPAAVGN
jgi:hypothetical protein